MGIFSFNKYTNIEATRAFGKTGENFLLIKTAISQRFEEFMLDARIPIKYFHIK